MVGAAPPGVGPAGVGNQPALQVQQTQDGPQRTDGRGEFRPAGARGWKLGHHPTVGEVQPEGVLDMPRREHLIDDAEFLEDDDDDNPPRR